MVDHHPHNVQEEAVDMEIENVVVVIVVVVGKFLITSSIIHQP